MAMHYLSDAEHAETGRLPSVETFYRTAAENAADGWEDGDGETLGEGWYWWACFPGCLPDSDPCGPFATEAEALADARHGYDEQN